MDGRSEIMRTYEKLGIQLRAQEMLAGVGAKRKPADPARRVAVDGGSTPSRSRTTFTEELKRPE